MTAPGSSPPVRLVGDRILHHSAHSGYDLLARHVPGAALIQGAIPRPVRDVAGALFYRALQRHVGAHHYSHRELLLEMTASIPFLLRAERTLFHVLYGDAAYWFLRHARRVRRHWLVASYHLPAPHLERDLRDRRQVRRLDGVVAVGPSQVPFFADLVGPSRVHVAPHGVDTVYFTPGTPAAPRARPYALFVGSHLRDFATLRDVARRLHDRAPGALDLVVVTNRARFEPLARLPGVELRSEVPEPDLLDLYRGALALLQPLEEATANNAILEGMACGTPVVATDVGDVGYYVGTSGAARLTRPGDAEGMVDVLLELTGAPSARAHMAEAARRRACELSWPEAGRRCAEVHALVSRDPPR